MTIAIQHIFIRSENLIQACKESICEKLSVYPLLFAVSALIFSLSFFSSSTGMFILTGDMRFQIGK